MSHEEREKERDLEMLTDTMERLDITESGLPLEKPLT